MKIDYRKIYVKFIGAFLLAISLSLSACVTTGTDTKAHSLYRFHCNNGEALYMKIDKNHVGIIKYQGRALKVTGRKMEQGAKYVTSDHRLILFHDQNDNVTIHVLREGSVFCQGAGVHEAG